MHSQATCYGFSKRHTNPSRKKWQMLGNHPTKPGTMKFHMVRIYSVATLQPLHSSKAHSTNPIECHPKTQRNHPKQRANTYNPPSHHTYIIQTVNPLQCTGVARGRALKCNLMGRCPQNLHNLFWKKICI